MAGPLTGVTIIDLTRYGPGPFAAMMLGDLGADVIVIDEAATPAQQAKRPSLVGRNSPLGSSSTDFMRRNHRRIGLNLKTPEGQEIIQRLIARADVVMEGFRPGVATRLGIGPEQVQEQHPRIIYCSISGYGQTGPYRDRPGHDINYIALGGLLGHTGRTGGPPVLPGTIIADLAGGGMQAVIGVLAALLARQETGRGQYIDVSLQEGVVNLMAPMLQMLNAGQPVGRGRTMLTGAAPWYNVYETADGKYLALGPVEPWFYVELCNILGRPEWIPHQFDTAKWPEIGEEMARLFKEQPLAVWRERLEEAETCMTAVPELSEILDDPQLKARGTFTRVTDTEGRETLQVRPLPPLPATPGEIRRASVEPGADTDAILAELGYAVEQREQFRTAGSIG